MFMRNQTDEESSLDLKSGVKSPLSSHKIPYMATIKKQKQIINKKEINEAAFEMSFKLTSS